MSQPDNTPLVTHVYPVTPVCTTQQLLDKVVELGKTYPKTHYYPKGGYCSYVRGDISAQFDQERPPGCGCIIGQALIEVSPVPQLTMTELSANENALAARPDLQPMWALTNQLAADKFLYAWLTDDDPQAMQAICLIQQMQDRGEHWGDAVAMGLSLSQPAPSNS